MKTLSPAEIATLPIQHRIQLVEDIWDSIADQADAVTVPDWHKQELDKRLADHRETPNEGSSWDQVKKRILEH